MTRLAPGQAKQQRPARHRAYRRHTRSDGKYHGERGVAASCAEDQPSDRNTQREPDRAHRTAVREGSVASVRRHERTWVYIWRSAFGMPCHGGSLGRALVIGPGPRRSPARPR